MTEDKKSMPVIPLDVTGETQRERVASIVEKLETGVQDIFTSGKFKEYLDFLSRFHDYSFGNTLLIAMQKPDATLVAGFSDWKKKHHRYVRKGETGIRILAPIIAKRRKDKDLKAQNGNQQQDTDTDDDCPVVCAFRVVSVFDVSQTEGDELPSIAVDNLTGDVDQYNTWLDILQSVAPVPVSFEDITGGSHGYFSPPEQRIAIRWNMPELQTIKTLIHEIAHAVLHAWPDGKKPENGPDRHTKEVQAESVAYVVCQHFGLETSDYSFGYVAGWSKGRDLPELKASLEVIRTTAHNLITQITDKLTEAKKEATV